jgi:hypothetical protein
LLAGRGRWPDCRQDSMVARKAWLQGGSVAVGLDGRSGRTVLYVTLHTIMPEEGVPIRHLTRVAPRWHLPRPIGREAWTLERWQHMATPVLSVLRNEYIIGGVQSSDMHACPAASVPKGGTQEGGRRPKGLGSPRDGVPPITLPLIHTTPLPLWGPERWRLHPFRVLAVLKVA